MQPYIRFHILYRKLIAVLRTARAGASPREGPRLALAFADSDPHPDIPIFHDIPAKSSMLMVLMPERSLRGSQSSELRDSARGDCGPRATSCRINPKHLNRFQYLRTSLLRAPC